MRIKGESKREGGEIVRGGIVIGKGEREKDSLHCSSELFL